MPPRLETDTPDANNEGVENNTDGMQGNDNGAGTETPVTESQTIFYANMYPGQAQPVPEDFARLVKQLEAIIKTPLILLIQNGETDYSGFTQEVLDVFFENRHGLERGDKVTVLVESPGGVGKYAFQIANLLKNHCGSFNVIVPRYAKSAATLFCLGAKSILMGENAELGPLDAQIYDPDPEKGRRSALDEVQTVERLHAAALESVDQCMIAWAGRSGKKLDVLLPIACKFVSDMMRPLHEKIDTINFTQMSRTLKDAEDYAYRLLRPRYQPYMAQRIASRLVEKYPVHSFFIGAEEAQGLGLEITPPSSEQTAIMDKMMPFLSSLTVIGQIEEVVKE